MGLPTRLSEVGVPESGIPALVEGAMGDGTTLLNPREMAEEDYEELYKQALWTPCWRVCSAPSSCSRA
jgi:alcohol dehydrogenase class IV